MAKYTAHVVRYSYARQMQEMVNIHNLLCITKKCCILGDNIWELNGKDDLKTDENNK